MIGVSVVSREIDRGWSVEKKETSTRYTYTHDTVMTLNVVQAIRAKLLVPSQHFRTSFAKRKETTIVRGTKGSPLVDRGEKSVDFWSEWMIATSYKTARSTFCLSWKSFELAFDTNIVSNYKHVGSGRLLKNCDTFRADDRAATVGGNHRAESCATLVAATRRNRPRSHQIS